MLTIMLLMNIVFTGISYRASIILSNFEKLTDSGMLAEIRQASRWTGYKPTSAHLLVYSNRDKIG